MQEPHIPSAIYPPASPTDQWKLIYRLGGLMAFLIVGIIPFQIVIFALWPPPDTPLDFLLLFDQHPFLGLLSLDLLYILNNILLIFVYLGLYFSLRNVAPSSSLIALILGLIGIAAYYASTVAFEMLALSQSYAADTPLAEQLHLLAVAEGLLLRYKGTAFDVYYVLNAVCLLIFSRQMYISNIFSKRTAIWGFAAGILMIIPSTAGMLGLVFSLLSLIPWIVFSILMGKKMIKLGT